ncbi:MAG: sigma-70 family RNA polymerase sigma factor, partial [Planctomycetota bacterium]
MLHTAENTAVWQEFDARYRPVLIAFARRAGLSLADAEDAAQEALLRFVKRYREGGYDRSRGRLRAWMAAIARNCVIDVHRARAARREVDASQFDAFPFDEQESETLWLDECNRAIMQRALVELRANSRTDPRTLEAFELVAFAQRPAAEVA